MKNTGKNPMKNTEKKSNEKYQKISLEPELPPSECVLTRTLGECPLADIWLSRAFLALP